MSVFDCEGQGGTYVSSIVMAKPGACCHTVDVHNEEQWFIAEHQMQQWFIKVW